VYDYDQDILKFFFLFDVQVYLIMKLYGEKKKYCLRWRRGAGGGAPASPREKCTGCWYGFPSVTVPVTLVQRSYKIPLRTLDHGPYRAASVFY